MRTGASAEPLKTQLSGLSKQYWVRVVGSGSRRDKNNKASDDVSVRIRPNWARRLLHHSSVTLAGWRNNPVINLVKTYDMEKKQVVQSMVALIKLLWIIPCVGSTVVWYNISSIHTLTNIISFSEMVQLIWPRVAARKCYFMLFLFLLLMHAWIILDMNSYKK